jgi:hypothetical protein
MRVIIIIGILLLFFIQSAISQPTRTIRGKVVDQESQNPLTGANILILEAGPITGVISDQGELPQWINLEDGRHPHTQS